MTTSSSTGSHAASTVHRPQPAVITSARGAASSELSQRVRRYTIAMAFRMACFLAMIAVHGWMRWVLLAVAVFMPYLAVVLANQSDQRSATPLGAVGPGPTTAITTGAAAHPASGEVIDGEVIDGVVVDGDEESLDRETLHRAA